MNRGDPAYTIEQAEGVWYVMKHDHLGMSAILTYQSEDLALHVATFLQSVDRLAAKEE